MSAVEAATPVEKHAGSQAELARKCLYYMSLMREVEDRVERKLYRQGKIAGAVYTGRGQEAIPVGSAPLAEPGDVLFPSHRDMAVFFIRGAPPRQIFAQYIGRGGGLTPPPESNNPQGAMRRQIGPLHPAPRASAP